mgnify:FL=1
MRKEKNCNRCNKVKHYSLFRKRNNKYGWKDIKSGIRYSYCKDCEAKSMEERCEKNPIPQMLSNSRIGAKNKNVPHNITTKDINDIWPKDNKCPVLNINFEMGYKNKKTKSYAPSLDRIEPKKGYVKGNILVICDIVNRLKLDASIEDLRKISNFLLI